MQGVVLEVTYHRMEKLTILDGWVYQVEIIIDNFSHIQYFGEQELDYTLQEKRDRRLKELGI